MTGLNDDVADDLDPNFDIEKELGDSLVVPPQDSQSTEVVNIITPVDKPVDTKVTDTDLFENPVPHKLPDLKATITLLKNNKNKILDLKDVEYLVTSQETINIKLADTVDEFFGNFYSKNLPRNSFSQNPTKINYNYTVKFIRDRISAEEAKLEADIKDYLKKAKFTILAKCEMIKNKDIIEAQNFIRNFSIYNKEAIERIINSKNLVIPVKSSFVNLLNDPIVNLKLADADWSYAKIDFSKFINSLTTLQTQLENKALVRFLNWIISTNSDTEKLKDYYCGFNDTLLTDITLSGLLKALIDDSFINALDIFNLELDKIKDDIENLVSNSDIVISFNNYADYIEKLIDELSFISNVALHLAFVNTAIKEIVDSLNVA